jgi:hypothetical protein
MHAGAATVIDAADLLVYCRRGGAPAHVLRHLVDLVAEPLIFDRFTESEYRIEGLWHNAGEFLPAMDVIHAAANAPGRPVSASRLHLATTRHDRRKERAQARIDRAIEQIGRLSPALSRALNPGLHLYLASHGLLWLTYRPVARRVLARDLRGNLRD